jgi:hypothetical protein
MTIRLVVSTLSAALYVAAAGNAQTVGYDFFGAPGSQVSTNATLLTSNLTAGPITRVNLTPRAATNTMTSSGFNNAFDPASYYTFTITPSAGFKLDSISSVTLLALRTGNGPTNLAIRSSADGFTANLDSDTLPNADTNTTVAFNFSSITTSAPLEFRIYGFNAANNGSGATLSFVSPSSGSFGVLVNGSVTPVPEAETYVLASLGLGLVGFGYFRKQRTVPKFA